MHRRGVVNNANISKIMQCNVLSNNTRRDDYFLTTTRKIYCTLIVE